MESILEPTVPAQDGGKCGGERVLTLPTSETRRYSMLQIEKMLKDKDCKPGTETMVLIKDGTLSIRIAQRRKDLRDMIKNSDSISIDFSISDQDFQ